MPYSLLIESGQCANTNVWLCNRHSSIERGESDRVYFGYTKGRHTAQWIHPLYDLYVFKIFPYVYTTLFVYIMYNKQTNNFWISFNIGVIFFGGGGWNVCHFSCHYMMLVQVQTRFFSCPSSFNLISCCRRAFRSALLRESRWFVFFATVRHFLFVGMVYRLCLQWQGSYIYIAFSIERFIYTKSSSENFDKFLCAIIWLFAESYINLI